MANGSKTLGKKPHPNRGKTPADVQEAVFAYYCVAQSYTRTARKFKMPISTVFGLVNDKAGGPELLEKLRNAKRADLIEQAFEAAGRLIPVIQAKDCGSKATSATADASRAFESLVRAGHLMTPDTGDKDAAPATINVYTGMAPPPELAANPGPETTTTLPKEPA